MVVNNDGGGIFSFLPISSYKDVFEEYFGAPHGLTFENAAAMFDLSYAQPKDLGSFVDAYKRAKGSGKNTIIEVRTNREQNLVTHQALIEMLSIH